MQTDNVMRELTHYYRSPERYTVETPTQNELFALQLLEFTLNIILLKSQK